MTSLVKCISFSAKAPGATRVLTSCACQLKSSRRKQMLPVRSASLEGIASPAQILFAGKGLTFGSLVRVFIVAVAVAITADFGGLQHVTAVDSDGNVSC